MYENLRLFQISHAIAKHAGQRQALVSQNIANSDTPNFKPRDLTSFKETYRGNSGMQATRTNHLFGSSLHGAASEVIVQDGLAESPNGNSVSVEEEMIRAVEVKRQHDRALAIYRPSMTVLRASIGRQ